MFFKKKSQTPIYKDDPIGFKLSYADSGIEIIKSTLPVNYAEKNFEYVVRNSSDAIESLIGKHALYVRSKKDWDLGRKALKDITPFLDHIENAIRQANAIGFTDTNFIHVKNLTFPFLALFLTEDWERAVRLAEACYLPVMKEEGLEGENNNPHDEIIKMIIALTLDDQKAFAHAQARYAKDKIIDRYFSVYFNYDELMSLIFKRDNAEFNKILARQEALFLQRSTDKKVDHNQVLDGFLENNPRVFDVWSVALAKLARHRGVLVDYSSEVIPLNVS